MIIDHFCFAVKDIDKGIKFWCSTFEYRQYTDIVVNTRQMVKVVFLDKQSSAMIKLIEPLEDNDALVRFIERGMSFHHICIRVDNLEAGIFKLSQRGLKQIVAPQPGEAFENSNIGFMLSSNGLNVEIIDTKNKANIIN